MKLWGRANSTNVRKARWCAAELNLNPELIEVGGPLAAWTRRNTGP
ncbi:thioredoxin domain-containing protein [Alloalcanivorax profundimaris]|nr:hypothetical protein [Alloalcanivorax profundimaris]MCQ6260904.1 hypothetical protein [Alcanivorax sp. MM125-6]